MRVRGRLTAAFAVVVISLSGCSSFWGSNSTTSLSSPSAASSTEAMLRVADALMDSGQYSQALPLLRVTHRRQPMNVHIMVRMGQALSGLGAYLEAVNVYDRAYRINPNSVEVARAMGSARLGLRRPDLALPHFELANELAPDDPESISGLGLSLIGVGAYGPGLAYLEEGALKHPDHKGVKSNYGLGLSLVGDHEHAIEQLREIALAKDATPKDRQNLALAYGLAGDDKTASKLSHIDLDARSVKNNVTFFKELSSMTPRSRIAILIGASPNPEQTTRHMANDAFLRKDDASEKDAQLATARLLGMNEEPVMVAEVAEVLETVEPTIGVPEPEESIEALEDGTLVPVLLGPKGYALQIAAYRSAEELLPGWEILRKQYADLIQDLPPRRSEVDYGPKEGSITGFYYRLNAGPLTEYEQARTICKEIRNRGGDCWVRPPEIAELETPADAAEASIGTLPEPVMEQPQPEEASMQTEPAEKTVWTPVGIPTDVGGGSNANFKAGSSTVTRTERSSRPGAPAGIIVSATPEVSDAPKDAETAEPEADGQGGPSLDDVGLAD